MANSNIELYENSQQDGAPIECFRFSYGMFSYLYTSHTDPISLTFVEHGITRTETYDCDFIKRSNLKPSTKGSAGSLDITVSKDNPVAKLFQGFPPETPIFITVYRFHRHNPENRDVFFFGRVGQASFEDSECTLIAKLESWVDKEIPSGTKSYYCNNVIYGKHCQLKETDWQKEYFIDHVEGLNVFCAAFATFPDGYFTDGLFRYDGYVRKIIAHSGWCVTLKYPFVEAPRNYVKVSPGCNHLFEVCANRFHNHLNFTGCPYVPPANPEHTAVGRGMYWVDSEVIQRDTDGYVGTISV